MERNKSMLFKKPLRRTKRSRTKELFVLNLAAISCGYGHSLFMIYFCIVEIKDVSEPMKRNIYTSFSQNSGSVIILRCILYSMLFLHFKEQKH